MLQWISYAEMGTMAHKFGAALRANGMQAAPTTTDLNQCKTPCRIAIFENTCADWMLAAIGAFTQAITVVTVYATLGMDAVVEAVKENSVPVIVCNQKDVARLTAQCKEMPSLKVIVYTKDLVGPNDNVEMPAALPRGVKVMSMEEFIDSGNVLSLIHI